MKYSKFKFQLSFINYYNGVFHPNQKYILKSKNQLLLKTITRSISYSGSFFFISSTILYAAGQIATFFKVRSVI
jgi:hypothetical protein